MRITYLKAMPRWCKKQKPTLKWIQGWEKNCYEKEKLSLERNLVIVKYIKIILISSVPLREHVLHLLEKGFVFLFGLWLEVLIATHTFKEVLLLLRKRARCPHIHMHQKIAFSVAV